MMHRKPLIDRIGEFLDDWGLLVCIALVIIMWIWL